MLRDEPGVYESNKQQVRENEIDMLTMRDTEANEWDGVHITGYDTMLPLRNSISPPREKSIPSIKPTLMPPNHSKLTTMMIVQEYDDRRIFVVP